MRLFFGLDVVALGQTPLSPIVTSQIYLAALRIHMGLEGCVYCTPSLRTCLSPRLLDAPDRVSKGPPGSPVRVPV